MIRRRSSFGSLLGGAVLCLAGCAASGSEEVTSTPVSTFEGETKPEFVGDWKTANGNSQMTLTEDGTATMVNVAPGRGKTNVSGKWRVQGAELLIRTNGAVTRYQASLKGDELHLKQAATKLDVRYQRSSPK